MYIHLIRKYVPAINISNFYAKRQKIKPQRLAGFTPEATTLSFGRAGKQLLARKYYSWYCRHFEIKTLAHFESLPWLTFRSISIIKQNIKQLRGHLEAGRKYSFLYYFNIVVKTKNLFCWGCRNFILFHYSQFLDILRQAWFCLKRRSKLEEVKYCESNY